MVPRQRGRSQLLHDVSSNRTAPGASCDPYVCKADGKGGFIDRYQSCAKTASRIERNGLVPNGRKPFNMIESYCASQHAACKWASARHPLVKEYCRCVRLDAIANNLGARRIVWNARLSASPSLGHLRCRRRRHRRRLHWYLNCPPRLRRLTPLSLQLRP